MTINELLDAIITELATLSLTVLGSALPMVKRKMPAKFDYDPAIQLNVCSSEQTGMTKPFMFKHVEVMHLADLVLIAPTNNDLITGIPDYALVMDAICVHFSKALTWSIATTWQLRNIRTKPKVFLNRSWLAEGYDYTAIEISVQEIRRVIS